MKKLLFLLILLSISIPCLSQNKDDIIDNDKIINMIGGRLNKLFETFGFPSSLIGYCDGAVMLDYATYGFKVKNKTVMICFFFLNGRNL